MKLLNWLFKHGSDQKLVVAEVKEYAKHPNADRLRVVKLWDGQSSIEPVVCGASNFEVGDKVVLARPGAEILKSHKDGKPFTLSKATIRGVESQGMICSKYELDLEDNPSDGILVLDESIRPGTSFSAKMLSQS